MINVSAEFKEQMKTRTDFKQYAEITLTNGAVWAVDESDFTVDNNSVSDSAGADGLPLGAMISRTIQIELMNDDNRFEDVDFMGAEIRLYLIFQLSNSVERVELGYFTVISPETYGETVIIEAMDNSWKLDTPYITSLAYPQSAGAVLRDICTRCSILFESATFNNYDFVIQTAPNDGLTNREMIGYIAMIAGGNARFNRSGKLEILTYEFPAFDVEEEKNYDGGTFDDWDSGDTLDGGTFDDWASGDDADGGVFDPWDSSSGSGGENIIVDDDTHVLTNWISLKPFTEDIIITGIQTTKTVEDSEGNETQETVKYGTDGYVLSIENPLIKGREEAALALIGDVLIGAHIRNFEGEHIGYPLAEFMDKAVVVDRKGNAMPTVLTDINFNFFGVTTMANSAAPPLRLSSKYNSAAAQAIIAAKDLVAKEKTQRELAIEALKTALSNSSGLYPTKVVQPDGSIISYLHDKPTLEESQTVIKVTAEAIGVSNDGGKTYSYGFFTNGDAILKILQAEGINAEWINTGTLTGTDSDGNVQFSFDVTTGNHWVNGDSVKINLGGTETDAQTLITANSNGVSQITTRLNKNYSTTAQIQSMIDDSATSIELSVTQSVTNNVGSIAQSEAQQAVSASLGLYVRKNENDQIVSMLNASANDINITGDRLRIQSSKFSVDYDGDIDATGGTIGGFTITDNKLYTDDHKNPAGQYVPGVALDNKNGEISVGAGRFKSTSSTLASIGTDNARIFFNESNESLGFVGSASFDDDLDVQGSTSLHDLALWTPLAVEDGGTGANNARTARENIGIITKSASVTVQSNGNSTVNISYSEGGFSVAPNVTFSLRHSSASKIYGHITEKNTSNCTIRVFSEASGPITVNIDAQIIGS